MMASGGIAAIGVDGKRVGRWGAYSNADGNPVGSGRNCVDGNALYCIDAAASRPPMTEQTRNLAILFADVAGSTRLYETLGDAAALALVNRCLAEVRLACEGHGGRIIKTIGDEMMAAFPDAGLAAEAAAEVQERIATLAPGERVRLARRIGFHFGPAIDTATTSSATPSTWPRGWSRSPRGSR